MKVNSMYFILLALVFFYMCRTPAKTTQNEGEQVADTLEYDLVIFDPDFDIWMSRNAKPINFYNEDYLVNWNTRLAQEWNTATMRGRVDCRPSSFLDYRPSLDYGKELNYRLFYYFRYMHERCRIFTSRPGDWRR
jgi:hypothetical protein